MKISMIGAGYVGLATGACFAKLGNEITFVDVDERKITALKNRTSPIREPALEEILKEIDFKATSDYRQIARSDVICICVPTPSNNCGSISLEHIEMAASQIAEVLAKTKDYCVIVVKSTVVPGTTEEVIIPILERSGKKAGSHFGMSVVPEFLREGNTLYDATHPNRIIIGEYDKRSGDIICHLYGDFQAPILRVDIKTAEMIKYASNAFLAAKISFINEIGNICKELGIDTYQVAKGMGSDPRIGDKFLNAGVGFGGSCLPKDLKALVAKAKELGYEPKLLESIRDVNEAQPWRMIDLLKKHLDLRGKTIGLLGLAFKPNTDDIAESRAIVIAKALLNEGAKIKAYDPWAMEKFQKLFPQVEYVGKEEILDCDAILIVTEWEEFKTLDYKGKIVIDGRRVPEAKKARVYEGICW